MRYWRVNEARDGSRGKPIPSTWVSLALAAVFGLDIGLAWTICLFACPGPAFLLLPFLLTLYPGKARK